MAGSYPDTPGPKIAYDVDGSGAFILSGFGTGSISTPSAATVRGWNGESFSTNMTSGALSGLVSHGFIFPVLMDLNGYFFASSLSNRPFSTLQTSTNTTNGIDGTWVTQVSSPSWSTGVSPQYRTIGALALTGIKSVRWHLYCDNSCGTTSFAAVAHFYGKPSSGEVFDRLQLWHPTLNQEVGGAYFDFGDLGRGGTFDRTFRVKNASTGLNAQGVVLSFDALTDTTPTVISQLTLSQGGAFAATQNIGNLAPGEISGICTMRVTSTSSTTLGVWRQRLQAIATTWA